MKSQVNFYFIHLIILLDNIGNWLFNIYLFNTIASYSQLAAFVALVFTFIRFSNFSSLLLGGRFFYKPKLTFYVSIIIRILALTSAFWFVDNLDSYKQLIFLFSVLMVKNMLSGIDSSIYNQILNKSLDTSKLHHEVKNLVFPVSLMLSWPIYELLSLNQESTVILFDILSYLLLFLVVYLYDFEPQKMKSSFFLTKQDLFSSINISPNIFKYLMFLVLLTLMHTSIFNYSYEYFLSSELYDNSVSSLYFIMGLGFLGGGLATRFFTISLSFSRIAVVFTLLWALLALFNANHYVYLTVFCLANVAFFYINMRVNVEYFSRIPRTYVTVLSNLYSLLALCSSILGAWILAGTGIESIYLIILNLLVFSIIFLTFLLFLYFEEKKVLKDLGMEVNFFKPNENNNRPGIFLYVERGAIRAGQYFDLGIRNLTSFFEKHSIVYSEALERLLSSKYNDLLPHSNGCAVHVDANKCKENALSEILERDSIILHYMYQQAPLYKYDSDDVGGCYYFFTTNSDDTLACMYYESDNDGVLSGIGYSSIKVQDFIEDRLEEAIWKAYSESHVFQITSQSIISTPEYNSKYSFEEYFNKNSDDHSHPALMFNILKHHSIKAFEFLKQPAKIQSPKDLQEKGWWERLHPFSKIQIDIKVDYYPEYSRYFSYSPNKNYVMPLWPIFTEQEIQKMRQRSANLNLHKNLPCPII